ncbi:MAG: ATP-binding protein [Ignavibacteria bacterium]|nr:ATP-binding protein [Ignavibacteria bacterium]
MDRFSPRTFGFLAVDLALLFLCVLHVPYLNDRPRAPLDIREKGASFVVEILRDQSATGSLRTGDTVMAWNGQHFLTHYDPELFADSQPIGAQETLTVMRSGVEETATIRLIPYYSTGYVILVLIIGIVSWCVGVFLLLVRGSDRTAVVLHWSLVNLGTIHIITWGMVPEGDTLALVHRVVFFFAYMNVVAAFVLFTMLFPQPKPGTFLLKSLILGVPAALLMVITSVYHLRALTTHSVADYEIFRSWFHVFHLGAIAYIALGTFNFIHSYRTTDSVEEQKKLKWLLWALSIGPAPFVFFTLMPELFVPTSFVSEEYTLVFFIIIPIAFTISFLRYHILDVEVVIHRTMVYAFAIAVLLAFYLAFVALVALFLGSSTPGVYAIAAVLAAVLFEPARKLVQGFVDRRFFRVRYNFREAERRFLELLKYTAGISELGTVLVRETQSLIPVERIGFFLLEPETSRLRCVVHENMHPLERRGVTFEPEKLKTGLDLPVALDECIEPGVPHESADASMFNRWGIALVFPMQSENYRFVGFLALGKKKSGARFTIEDVDLLRNVALPAALDIERIRLQQSLVTKEAETRHLQELNDMKTTFVEYVSHEFKTPLGGIKIHAELLQRPPRKVDAKARKHLAVIDGEVERLNRMVINILDAARMESGAQVYHCKPTDLREISIRAVKTMEYLLKKNEFRWVFHPGRVPLPIVADPDAVHLALTNLIGNSLKYYGRKRFIRISLKSNRQNALCSVQDQGRGIAPEALPHLFERYYRGSEVKKKVRGVGLGLSMVKHIMDAHGGSVKVTSEPGKGSTFTLQFPLRKRST